MRASSGRFTAEALEQFDSQVGEIVVPETDWDTSAARRLLERELMAHCNEVRLQRVSTAMTAAEGAAQRDITSAAISLLEAPPADLWPRLAALLARAVRKGQAALDAAVEGYGLSIQEQANLHNQLAAVARKQLAVHAREAANTALSRVKDRFNEVFQRDEKGMPRTWQPSVDIPAVTIAARKGAAQLLAQLSFIRLGGTPTPEAAAVDAALERLAEEPTPSSSGASAAGGGAGRSRRGDTALPDFDLLAAAEWPGVVEGDVLLTPQQVRSAWRHFMSDSSFAVQQAMATQEANRAAQNRMPPLWAIAAMVVLGFNEFLAVLYNPFWLVLLLLLFLFGKTVYQVGRCWGFTRPEWAVGSCAGWDAVGAVPAQHGAAVPAWELCGAVNVQEHAACLPACYT